VEEVDVEFLHSGVFLQVLLEEVDHVGFYGAGFDGEFYLFGHGAFHRFDELVALHFKLPAVLEFFGAIKAHPGLVETGYHCGEAVGEKGIKGGIVFAPKRKLGFSGIILNAHVGKAFTRPGYAMVGIGNKARQAKWLGSIALQADVFNKLVELIEWGDYLMLQLKLAENLPFKPLALQACNKVKIVRNETPMRYGYVLEKSTAFHLDTHVVTISLTL